VRTGWRRTETVGYELVFGQAGYDVSVSPVPHYMADASTSRTRQPESVGYVLRDVADLPKGLRLRIARGADVLYEAGVASPGGSYSGTVYPTPLYGRGKSAPRAVKAAADALAFSAGLTGPDVHYIVLRSDDFPHPQRRRGPGQIATVVALTPDGGGPYSLSPPTRTRNPTPATTRPAPASPTTRN